MIGRQAESVLNRAVRFAVEQDHEYFTLEHVLLSLLSETPVAEAFEACGGNLDRIRSALEVFLKTEVPKAPPRPQVDPGQVEPSGTDHPVATLGIQRLIQRALFHVQSAGKSEIQPLDLFVALFQAKESHALYLISEQGVERLEVLNYISHGMSPDQARGEPGDQENSESKPEEAAERGGAKKADDPLALYTVNLNQRAMAGRLDPLVGRQNELNRVIQTLCRRRKNNPILVGEAGVGKTALAEGLAVRIVEKMVPHLLEKAVIYSLDLGALLAGTKFRGDFEQRFKRVLQALELKRSQGLMPILLIDEIHTIIGAGAVSGGALDAAHLLKPLLSQGDLRCLGSTTYTEYRTVFEKDHALARRFQKVDIAEPSQDETVQILMGLKAKLEEHHRVTYTHEAIKTAVELSVKHLNDRFLPDKAIDVLDEAGAKAHLEGNITVIDADRIEEMIAQIARIPARSVTQSQKERLRNLERDLKLAIFGQDPAIEALSVAIRLARSGLRTGEKPVGSFLFCGPTGVGKTELAKQIGHYLGVPFLRFDMSEYGEKHTVSRLIGAPPGYVGFDQAGLLTDAVMKNPHSVVLLDEIEKAHPDIWNILLQVMDHGFLTDNNGKKSDFRNVVLIMTSNVGSREMERRSLGLVVGNQSQSNAQKALENTFSPEFRNRLDSIVFFNPLDPQTVAQIVNKQLMELESQLLAKNVEMDVTAEARKWLAIKGYDRQMGARPMARLIQDKIKKTLSEEILFGRLENGGEVSISLTKDELVFDVRPRKIQIATERAKMA